MSDIATAVIHPIVPVPEGVVFPGTVVTLVLDSLEAETEQATGFMQRGSIAIATNHERLEELKLEAQISPLPPVVLGGMLVVILIVGPFQDALFGFVLIANAGIGNAARSFIEMTTEQYRKVLAVNLDGVFFTMREAARHMRERASRGDKGGSLVGVASLAAIEGAARNEHYAATKGALIAFDNLSDRMKAEQTASTISRLEMFLCDEIVRQVVCSPRSLDVEILLAERKIILVNFGRYQPLLPDALKLLGRFFFNDLLAHLYKGNGEGKFDEKNPCFVLCDEIQNFATKQTCDSLDEGRGIGCHMTIAHQHLSQLKDEDQSGYLYNSVLTDARTKVIFPGVSPADLEVLAQIPLLKHYDPLKVKFIQRTPSYRPVETVRDTAKLLATHLFWSHFSETAKAFAFALTRTAAALS
jgi:hypothetical protein